MNEDALRLIRAVVALGENQTLVGMQLPESAVEIQAVTKTPQGFKAEAVTALGDPKIYEITYEEALGQARLTSYIKLYDKVFNVTEQSEAPADELPELPDELEPLEEKDETEEQEEESK